MHPRKTLLNIISCFIFIFFLVGCSIGNEKRIDSTKTLPSPTLTPVPGPVQSLVTRMHFTATISPVNTLSPTVLDSPIPSATLTILWTLTPTASGTATELPTSSPSPTSLPVMPGWIAFANWRPNFEGVYVVDTEGKNWKKLTTETGFYYSPTWSPDGHWIAYFMNSKNTFGIFVVNIDGSRSRRVDIGYPPLQIAWSPDGEKFAYDGGDDLYVYNLTSGARTRLTNLTLYEGSPTWSPDGKKIAYLQQREDITNGAELYIINADGSGKRRVTDVVNRHSRLGWSPDGQKIAFRSYDGCGDIYTVDEDGGDLVQLTDNPLYESDPSWSPDGRYIAYIADTDSCNQHGGGESGVLKDWVIKIITKDGQALVSIASNPEWSPPLEPIWSPVPALQVSDLYRITAAGANLNLRESPSINAKVLKKLAEGDGVTILEGPVDADDYYWWRMRTEDGIEGWAVEVFGWYTLANNQFMTPTLTPPP